VAPSSGHIQHSNINNINICFFEYIGLILSQLFIISAARTHFNLNFTIFYARNSPEFFYMTVKILRFRVPGNLKSSGKIRRSRGLRQAWTDLSLVVAVANSEVWHGPQDGHKGLNSVAIHYRSVLFEIFAGEPTLVDDSGTEEDHQSEAKRKRAT
jgi:hypothetical protein